MRVLVLVDKIFALRERTMLRRLEVGLADEGATVSWCVNSDAGEIEIGDWFSKTIQVPKTGPFSQRSSAVKRVDELVRDAAGGPPDVIHAYGGRMWDFALDLGELASVPVALEVWRDGLARRAAGLRLPSQSAMPLLITPGRSIERTLRDEGGTFPVRTIPWGVHASSRKRPVRPDTALSVLLTGTGREKQAFCAAFEGIVRAIPNDREVVVFADADAAERSGLWKLAKRLDVTDKFSLIEDMEGRRELVLRGDILVQPESHGEYRSLLLDAMSNGMAVVASRDPAVDYLADGVTASLVSGPGVTPWTDHLRPLLEEPQRLQSLRDSAAKYASANHKASAQVMGILNAYQWMRSSEAIPLRGRD